jgi:hypothetical protein
MGLMVDQCFSTDTLAVLFPEVRLSNVEPGDVRERFLRALGRFREFALARLAFEQIGRVAREGPLPPFPTTPRPSSTDLTDWRSNFSRSSSGRDTFFVSGTQYSHYGAEFLQNSREHRVFSLVLRICEDFGLVRSFRFVGWVPWEKSSQEDHATFLDGGVMSRAGFYLDPARGTRIIGRAAIRFLCFQLGLTVPRWPSTRGPAPSHEDLVRQILIQFSTELPVLRQRLGDFGG